MRFAYLTDLHVKGINPEHRLDNYPDALALKLESFGWGIQQNGIQFVLIGGDVFDIPKVSNKLLGNISRILRSWGIPIYVLPGNHDIYGHNLGTLEHTSLGLLVSTGVVQLLTRTGSPYKFHIATDPDCPVVSVTAMEYIDDGVKCSDVYDPRDYQVDRTKGDINILMAHAMIMPQPSPHFQCIDLNGVDTNADMVLCSHFHQRFEHSNQNGTLFLNPGPTGRTDASAYNIDPAHVPGFHLIDITKSGGIRYGFYQYQAALPGNAVFDVKAIQKQKTHQVTLNTLKQQLKANIQPGSNIVTDIYTILGDVCKQKSATSAIEATAKQHIQNAEHNAANNSMIAQGYIPAYKPVYIKRIHMKNFQSHKDTTMEFDEAGFNAIVGETDKGKSAIVRFIQWVLHNEPNGTDMIRIGENECSGTIEMSNGNKVTRTRNRKSAGTYEVYDANTGKTTPFKSFGRTIPIEVTNAHQIPKGPNIAEQLEGPYMLSKTAPERAAMVGSIVGTDIVDAAIKEVSSDILAAQKVGKRYDDVVSELEAKLRAYDTLPAEKQHVDSIASILADINTLNAEYIQLWNLNDAYTKADYERGQAEYYLSLYNNLDKVQTIIAEVEALNAEANLLSSLEQGHHNNTQQIAYLSSQLETFNTLPQVQGIIDTIDKAAVEYDSLVALYNQHDTASKAVAKYTKELKLYDGVDKIDVSAIEGIYNDAIELNRLLSQYQQAESTVALAEQNLASVPDPDEILTQYQALLVQLGKCPTCGVLIDSTTASHIEL